MTKSINDIIASSIVEGVAVKDAAVIVNGDVLFTAVGDVEIINLFSECISANDITASTVQYSITPTVGSATAISGASASLASALAGSTLTLDGTALSTAPNYATTGVSLGTIRGIVFKSGTLKVVVGVGSTTGTWKHYLRYKPLESGAYVS